MNTSNADLTIVALNYNISKAEFTMSTHSVKLPHSVELTSTPI